ncbi:SCO family protein [Rhodanobacter lindaniclasticus]
MPMLRTLLASGLLLVLGGTVLTAATDGFQAFTSEAARRIAVQRDPPPVPAVPLETQSGAQLNLTDLRGRWVLVDFIYTRCLTWCLALGGEFAQLQDQLAVPLADGKLVLLSISFDPAHDTPAELAAYQQRFRGRGHGWIAARPVDHDGLRQLLRTFGVTVVPDTMGGYVHNAAILMIDPHGRLVRIFDTGNPPAVARAVRGEVER